MLSRQFRWAFLLAGFLMGAAIGYESHDFIRMKNTALLEWCEAQIMEAPISYRNLAAAFAYAQAGNAADATGMPVTRNPPSPDMPFGSVTVPVSVKIQGSGTEKYRVVVNTCGQVVSFERVWI